MTLEKAQVERILLYLWIVLMALVFVFSGTML
jgi:hypothetical protein